MTTGDRPAYTGWSSQSFITSVTIAARASEAHSGTNDSLEYAAEVKVRCYFPVEDEAMKEPKQIAYFYETILADEETELDLDGTVAVPAKGDTRQHGGKTSRACNDRSYVA